MELTCRQVLEFATIEGARACGMDRKIGSLAPGKRADVILVRTDTWSMTPLNNPIGQFVHNARLGPGGHHPGRRQGGQARRQAAHRRFRGVRRLANDARDDIVRRAAGKNGLQLGGEWIPQPIRPRTDTGVAHNYRGGADELRPFKSSSVGPGAAVEAGPIGLG